VLPYLVTKVTAVKAMLLSLWLSGNADGQAEVFSASKFQSTVFNLFFHLAEAALHQSLCYCLSRF
jgi:hypothetical protein